MEEHLSPDFDPSAQTVPRLRNILMQHGIQLPATAKKADLIATYEEKIRPQAVSIRAKQSSVKASGKGIVAVSENGDEVPVEPPKRGRGRPRKTTTATPSAATSAEPEASRSTRTSRGRKSKSTDADDEDDLQENIVITPSVAKADEEAPVLAPKKRGRPKKVVPKEVEEVSPDADLEMEDKSNLAPPRRSRQSTSVASSAPSAVTPARRGRPSSVLAPERQTPSEVSDVIAVPPPRSILKKEPSISAIREHEGSEQEDVPRQTPTKRKLKAARRSSGEEESGFSDYNPFQSGDEGTARKKDARRWKSTAGPVQIEVPQQQTSRKPRQSEPVPMSFTPGALRRVGPSRENLKTPPKEVKEQLRRENELRRAEEYNQEVSSKLNRISSKDDSPPKVVITQSMAPATERSALVKRSQQSLEAVPAPRRTIPLAMLALLLLTWLGSYKNASSSIGFCDTQGNTNDIVLNRESRIDNAEACLARRAALEDQSNAHTIQCDTSALPLVPYVPRPTACAPCPPHAQCSNGELVACEPEFILTPHPLSIISPLLDGLPGVGPKAFPPHCRPDTAKKRMIGGLAQEVEGHLARGRGEVVCAGLDRETRKEQKGEGEIYGVAEDVLKGVFEARRDPKFPQEQFDEVWEMALKDLVEHEDLVETIDVNGKSWYAAKRTDMTVGCRMKTEAYRSLDAWKAQLGSTAAVIAAILALQRSVKNRKVEKYRAEELALVVLKRLQDQERLHYTDPSTTPHSYLPPDQVRDLVLPPRGSVASRTRLWKKVEDMVENNSNVRTREREVDGEVWRTWEWAGVGMVQD